MINTVLGKIKAEALGNVYIHEHVYADLSPVRKEDDSLLTNTDEIISEFSVAVAAGINTFVDVSCIGMGRDVTKLKKISQAIGAHVICSTGFYLTSYYPEYVYTETYQELAKRFIEDIQTGIDGTTICAGIIGEIATGKNEFTDDNKKVFRAAAMAHRATGVPVTTHASAATMALEQAKFLINEGIDPNKIIIGHMDLCNDLNYIKSVLATGVNIGFDTVGKNSYLSNETRVNNLVALVNDGFVGQIVLSEDISRKSYYSCNGGHGYGYLLTHFLPELRLKGISDIQIDIMLKENPKKVLDIVENIWQSALISDRVKILVDNDAVAPRAALLCNKFIEYVSSSNKIDRTHQNYDMFETHLVMAVNRMIQGGAITDIPTELTDEVDGTWFCDLSINSLKRLCDEEKIFYSEAEAKFLSVHLGVILEEGK